MDITSGVEHTLSTGEGLAGPLGLLATVKEAPTPGRGLEVYIWAMIEQQETAPPTDSAPTRQRSQEEILAKTICWVQWSVVQQESALYKERARAKEDSAGLGRPPGLPSPPHADWGPYYNRSSDEAAFSPQGDHGPLDPSARLGGPPFGHYDHHGVHYVCGGDRLPQYGERRMVS